MAYPLSANMKILRAHEHLEALEVAAIRWLYPPPYTISGQEDSNLGLYVCRVDMHVSDNAIPALLGDFLCNLRSSLEHLAWQLAHLSPKRVFTDRQVKQICFPVFEERTDLYDSIRGLFPSAVAIEIDELQPFKRGAAFPEHPLWQLHKLWNLDKHREIPISPTSMKLTFPQYNGEYTGWMRVFEKHLEVRFPLSVARNCPVKFEPEVSIDILFGEGDDFVVPWSRLREIYDFVRNDAVPRFAGFFA